MFKQWFLPTKENYYHPLLLRPLAISIILALVVLQPLLYNLTTAHTFRLASYASDISAGDIISLTNQQRAANGVAALAENAELDQAAQAKATDMFAKNYWAHDSPTGETPWTFILNSGYQYSAAAENLAMDFLTSNAVVDAWMGSTEHRTNILNSGYTDVGVVVMNGTLQGEQTTLVVAMYGAPLRKVVAAPPTSVSPTPQPTTQTATPTSPPTTPTTTSPASSPSAQNPSTNSSPSHTTGTAPVVIAPAASAEKPVQLSLVARIKHLDALNWGQKASVLLLGTLVLVELLKHTIVWRKQKRGWRHIWLRSHPAFQASLLAIVLIVVIVSGYGTIV